MATRAGYVEDMHLKALASSIDFSARARDNTLEESEKSSSTAARNNHK